MMSSSAPSRHAPRFLFAAALLGCLCIAPAPAAAASPFTAFESGQVRPLAMSADGKLLFAVNTPDNRLEVFRITSNTLVHRSSIPVGLEPVAVAARGNSEVWVVNHLSDSISVVELDGGEGLSGRVVRTLLVGDEPRDIVFGGHGHDRAFITTAHRGQNIPFDPQLTTPGVGRADVWVFNADALGSSLGGQPLTIVTLFTDTPRALAVTPDGSRVYAAGFHTGNRTTVVSEFWIPDGGEANSGMPGPDTNFDGEPRPETGLIVKFNGQHWVDETGRSWDDGVKFSLPDKDVFVIDAMANPPAQLPGSAGFFSGVGTILNAMAVNPANGDVYVANTEAFNEVRFEGPGTFAGTSVQGHLHESRITILGHNGSVTPRHLNKHINYAACCAPVPNAEGEKSLAFPQGMAVTSNGKTLYVAALGSSKIGVFTTAKLANDTFVPSASQQISVTGGGPTGVLLDESRGRLYALTRFDNSISVLRTTNPAEIAHIAMHNPEPESLVQGRRFLYDARHSSSHGDSACASCHVFADLDSLAWDLGNPDAESFPNLGPFNGDPVIPKVFSPMKGPMTTQSLRGMENHGPMHWRGDRTGGNDAPSAQPNSGTFDERAAFKKFAPAFVDLLGRDEALSSAEMAAFTKFILQITYPPNPIRALDNSLNPMEQAGHDIFFGDVTDGSHSCVGCHVLDRSANPTSPAPGFFGTDGRYVFDFIPQQLKVPHLRNVYQKVGMFGNVRSSNFDVQPPDYDIYFDRGDQIRGFGVLHDGAFSNPFTFFTTIGFDQDPALNPAGIPVGTAGDLMRRQLEAFVLAFDSNLAPIVGQQITVTPTNQAVAGPRVNLLASRAAAGECELVAKSRWLGRERGFYYLGGGHFKSDEAGAPPISSAHLRQLAALLSSELTYTCVPPGSGVRVGIDRDGDGYFDGDEWNACSDPADPSSTP